jgi:hypothetical protein
VIEDLGGARRPARPAGEREAEQVAAAVEHIRQEHSELAELITPDQILVTVREVPYALRANGIDLTQRVLGRCPFDDWELMMVYGLR